MKEDRCIEVEFLKSLYYINLDDNTGLDDLVYDLKLNEFIDKEFEVTSVYDLEELFRDKVIIMMNSKGYRGRICDKCNMPLFQGDDIARIRGKFYCKDCMKW